MARLEGKVAFISGGARGMGATEAKLFAAEGARVVLGDVLEEAGRATESRISAAGGQALFVKLDATSEPSWKGAIAATVSRFRRLDVLVNNAGIGSGVGPSMVEDTDEERWDRVMAVNSTGVFLGTKYAIPEMRKAGCGSIINISSIFGLVGSPGSTPYNASKGAVRLFTKATAIQYAKDGIRANTVHPGFIDTPMTEAQLSQPGGRQKRIASTPLGRIGSPHGHRLRGALSGLGGVLVRHRVRAGHRWWLRRPIRAAAGGKVEVQQASLASWKRATRHHLRCSGLAAGKPSSRGFFRSPIRRLVRRSARGWTPCRIPGSGPGPPGPVPLMSLRVRHR